MAVQSDEQRFGECAPVLVECASCGVTKPLTLWPKAGRLPGRGASPPSHVRRARLGCWATSRPRRAFLVSAAARAETRGAPKRYYEGWTVCDDSACGPERALSGAGPRLRRGCRGRMVARVGAAHLHAPLLPEGSVLCLRGSLVPSNSDEAVCAFPERQAHRSPASFRSRTCVRSHIFAVFGKRCERALLAPPTWLCHPSLHESRRLRTPRRRCSGPVLAFCYACECARRRCSDPVLAFWRLARRRGERRRRVHVSESKKISMQTEVRTSPGRAGRPVPRDGEGGPSFCVSEKRWRILQQRSAGRDSVLSCHFLAIVVCRIGN